MRRLCGVSYQQSYSHSLKIPYTRGNFRTEGGFISAYRSEHRHSHSAEGHSWGKTQAESIWRAMTFWWKTFTPMCWETRLALSVTGHSQKSHPLWSGAFAQTEIYSPSILTSVTSFDPHSETVIEPERVYNTSLTGGKSDSQRCGVLLKGHRGVSWRTTQTFWCLKLCCSTSSPWPGEVSHLEETSSPASIKYKMVHSEVEHWLKTWVCFVLLMRHLLTAIPPRCLGQVGEVSPWCLAPL